MSETAHDERGALPWTDRPAAERPVQARSAEDMRSLQALARRIPPRDAGAHNNLGVVYFQKGMIAEAAEQFELALELDPRMQVAERNLNIAYFNTGWFDERLRELRLRIEADSGDLEARQRLARTLLHGGDARAAMRELQRAAELWPADVSILRQLARAQSRLGDADGAVASLRYAAELAPHDAGIRVRIGEVMYQRGHLEEARAALEQAIALDDTTAEAHHYLAFVYGELGDVARATAAGARAQALDPGLSRAQRSLSLDGYSAARYDELLGERAPHPVETGADGALVHYAVALALRQKGLYEESARELERARSRGEDAYLIGQAEAELALLSGRAGQATEQYEALIELEPASPKLWNELGAAHHQAGALEAAANAYGRAIELDEAYALAWNNFAIARHHRGEEGAQEAFERALAGGRAPAEVARNLGWFWHRRGEPARAEECYRLALARIPGLATAWTGLGMLYLESGRIGEARRALAQAVESDPLLPEARYHYAFALSASGDYPGALRETSRALELSPYITTPRFRLLIDLQFEDASVPAPDLDVAEQLPAGETVAAFDFQPAELEAILVEEHGDVGDAAPVPASDPDLTSAASIEPLAAARVALDAGQYAEADAHTRRAALQGASPADVALLQAEVFLAGGAAGEAVDRFGAVLAARDEGAVVAPEALQRTLHDMAAALLELGRGEEALRHAEALYEEVAGSPPAAVLLARACDATGQPERAIQILERAVAQRPADVDLLTRLGDACLRRGERGRAELVLRQALANDGDAPAARTALARALEMADHLDEAAAQYAAALRIIPSWAEAAFGLADLAFGRGDVDQAIRVLASFLDVDPYNLAGLVRLGDVLWISGRESEASVAYRRVLRFDPAHAEARDGLERLMPVAVASPEPDHQPWPARV